MIDDIVAGMREIMITGTICYCVIIIIKSIFKNK